MTRELVYRNGDDEKWREEETQISLEKAKLSSQEIVPLIYQKTYDINKNSVDSSAESVDRVSVVAR